jgi:cytochrome c oxidase cbb3-type subunit 3
MSEGDDVAAGPSPGTASGSNAVPAVGLIVGGGLVAILAAGAVVYRFLRETAPPAPAVVAADPLLSKGRSIYLDRCLSCHGPKGKGDGPIAKGLAGPPVGDLTDSTWKHGDRPEQVEGVVADGVKTASMPGWKTTIGAEGVRAVSAYVYYLAGRPVPDEWKADAKTQ